MTKEPIWITGAGVNVPHGVTVAEVADGLLAGRSAIHRIDHFDVSNHPCQIGSRLTTFPKPDGWEGDFASLIPVEQVAIWCIVSALKNAGLWESRHNLRIGLAFSSAGEFGLHWERMGHMNPDIPACELAYDQRPLIAFLKQNLGLTGPSATLSTACSSGNYALAQAKRWLELGWCDAVVAGAADLTLTPLVLAGFGNLRALSRLNDDPQGASRPFDKNRDGFVMGEGGTAFVLEPASKAKARSAVPLGELMSVGLSSDAYHPVIPAPNPVQAIAAVQKALTEARLDASAVHYVNAHGTATPVGDTAEAKGLREIFGENYRNIPVSSTKSMSGHLITAASAFEALACLITFERQAIPPTINLREIDPECDLCHVPLTAREGRVDVAISNSFGFGGSNSCAVFRRV
ncbi:beta-ketoacyl-[acyl-carrier-protein] synthase family protein [Zavarzinella formosa]|uniref:beta-ketoacyl-[acyl-carrier-protein] synthase family protein n=1 Tax=Zavarzinella formosa TaxID=360055 RepID=UPI0002D8150A|nr:beta-ketoacyl-[acyl-carrier-protein] synthase family protein [Zavarzinella formosa]